MTRLAAVRAGRRSAWPTLSLVLVALLAVLAALLLVGSRRSAASAPFSLQLSPASLNLAAGKTADITVTVAAQPGFAGSVSLDSSALPDGVSARFGAGSLQLTQATTTASTSLQVTTTTAAATGALGIEVTAHSGGSSQHSLLRLTITPAPQTDAVNPPPALPRFSVAGTPIGRLRQNAILPIQVVIANASDRPLLIRRLLVTVAATSRRGCSTGNFAVIQYSGSYPLVVPARARRSLSSLKVPSSRWPRLRMALLTGQSKACAGVRVTLSFSTAS